MRPFLRAMVLSLAIGSLLPTAAFSQDDNDFDDDAPPPPRPTERRGRGSWKRSPVVWGTVGVVLCVAIPLGIYKLVNDMRKWREDVTREKEPWERAMAEAERKRPQ